MRVRRLKRTIPILATLVLTAAAPPAALAVFEADFKPDAETVKAMGVEKPTQARDLVDQVSLYIRIAPLPGKGSQVYPAFINTRNYLVCPDSDKHYLLKKVSRVANDRRRGIKVLAFFFDKPACEKATFHMSAVVGH